MLACRVVCCTHQSDRCIRVCILHQSDFRIRVCISHQSYNSIWISCTNHSVWVLFSCKSDVMESGGLCTKNDVNQKFWAHFISVMILAFAGASSSQAGIYRNMKSNERFAFISLYNFQVKICFFRFFSHNAHAKQLTFHHIL